MDEMTATAAILAAVWAVEADRLVEAMREDGDGALARAVLRAALGLLAEHVAAVVR